MVSSVPTLFTEYITWKIADFQKTGSRGEATLRQYKRFRGWIVDFEDECLSGEKIDLLSVNNDIIKRFVEWSLIRTFEVDGIQKKYSLNYITRLKTEWKLWLNLAKNEDDINIPPLNLKKEYLKKVTERADDVYMTLEQVYLLKRLKFKPSEKTLEKVRDLFVVGCSNGYRITDSKDAILYNAGEEYYFMISKMTKVREVGARVPLFDKDVIKIYQKYDDVLPVISEQAFNRLIKQVCEMAGLTHMVEKRSTDALSKTLIKRKIMFCDMVSSRTCRKTFASNLIREYNIPLVVAMSYTGHTTEKHFKDYVRLTQDEYYQISMKHMQYHRLKK